MGSKGVVANAVVWPHVVEPALAWGMANLLVGLGEPALSKDATQPLTHWWDACSQTFLPYLRLTLASPQLGNCHLLTDCNVFSFIFNDNR